LAVVVSENNFRAGTVNLEKMFWERIPGPVCCLTNFTTEQSVGQIVGGANCLWRSTVAHMNNLWSLLKKQIVVYDGQNKNYFINSLLANVPFNMTFLCILLFILTMIMSLVDED
jgi:hypothetical protein